MTEPIDNALIKENLVRRYQVSYQRRVKRADGDGLRAERAGAEGRARQRIRKSYASPALMRLPPSRS